MARTVYTDRPGVSGNCVLWSQPSAFSPFPTRHRRCLSFGMPRGVQRFTDLRAWQACELYKRAVYRSCERAPLAYDWKRRGQLEESVRGPGAHVAEGFGRFSPPDFARFVVMARASLMESQDHLIDLVDRGYIKEKEREALNQLAEAALQEVTGLLEYLQSPEALRNARRARERRIAERSERGARNSALGSRPPEQRNPEPRTLNAELGTEPRTRTKK